MQNLANKPISPTLKNMQVDAIEIFPKSQYSSLCTIFSRLKIEQNLKFSKEIKEDCIVVQRLSDYA
ncbi:hypothetical protein [Carboxylicivirga marina]|uniref:Uncharacterized protein n=1 Tax=Carboxylicivirga marina TaxID=2800988 RepID=A0ABS1HG89_9BACT|nr:hypothetical protein [Carboxylicivirga marina]MBK3516677.1 hypothetical protein [Carboxylicivirga marina]